MAQLINGKAVAQEVLAECAQEILCIKEKGITPGLAVVLVGEDAASRIYVGNKVKTCQKLGIFSQKIELPTKTTQEKLIETIKTLNNAPSIHGILVQSPLPAHIDEGTVVKTIDPRKDVDGFNPQNVAKLAMEDASCFIPCTPAGCMRLLESIDFNCTGAEAVVLGRSLIVGKPLALLLSNKGIDATVTLAHSRTKNLAEVCRRADLLIAAVGQPELVKGNFIKKGAVVLDVGINRVTDVTSKKGYRLTGDVDFEEASKQAKAITPVPGGIGPMTIAMLMKNTIKSACQFHPTSST